MLDKLLNLATLEELVSISLEYADDSKRTQLYTELAGRGICMDMDDMLSPAELHDAMGSTEKFVDCLKKTSGQSVSIGAKVVRRLQLLGTVNPSVSDMVSHYLERACI